MLGPGQIGKRQRAICFRFSAVRIGSILRLTLQQYLHDAARHGWRSATGAADQDHELYAGPLDDGRAVARDINRQTNAYGAGSGR